MVDSQNIQTTQPSKKLDDKWYGPFKVIEKIGALSYKLDIPHNWSGIHNIFNENLLKLFYTPTNELHKDKHPLPPLELVANNLEHKVEELLDCHKKGRQWQYQVAWKGYPRNEVTWQLLKDILPNTKDAVKEFHITHPEVPQPPAIQRIEFMPELFRFQFFDQNREDMDDNNKGMVVILQCLAGL